MAAGIENPESALASNTEEVDQELEGEALGGKTQEIYQDDNLGTNTAETCFETPLLAKVGTDEVPQEVKVKNGHVEAVAPTEASDKNQQNAEDRMKEKDDTEGLVEDETELETNLYQVAERTVHLLDPTKVLDNENQNTMLASKEEGLADNSCTKMTPFEEDLQGTSYQSEETEALSLTPTGQNSKEIEETEESEERKIMQEEVVVNSTTNFCSSTEAKASNNHNKEEVTESDGGANENTGSSGSDARADKHKENSENSSPKTSMIEEETLLEDKPEEKEQDINLFTEKENDEENIQRPYDAASEKFEETDNNEHEEPDVDFKGQSLRENEEKTLEETKEKPLDDHDINVNGSLEVKNPSTSGLNKNAETTEPEIPIQKNSGSYNIHQQANASDSETQKLQTNDDNWESTAENGATVKCSNKTSTKQETDEENNNRQGGSMEVLSELNRRDQSCKIEDHTERTTMPVIAEEENDVDCKTFIEGNTEEERENEDNGIKGQSAEATTEDIVSYCHEHEPETEKRQEIETYKDIQDPIEHVEMDGKSMEDQVLVSTQENLAAENKKPDEMIIEKHNQEVQMIFGDAAEDMDLGAQIIEQGGETQNRYTEYAEATKEESSKSKQEEPIMEIYENGKGTKETIEQTTMESANKAESAIGEDVPEILKENESVALGPKEEGKSVETDYIEQELYATSHVEKTKTRDMTIDSKQNEVGDSDCIEEGPHPKEPNENLAADSSAPLVPQDETEHDASREMESANLETTEEISLQEVKAEENLQSASSDTCLEETGIEYLKPHGTRPEDINTARKLAEASEMESVDVRNDQADIERNKDQQLYLADAVHTELGTNEYNEQNLGSVETREEMESDPVSMVKGEDNETLCVAHKTNSEEEVVGHEGKREDEEVESKIEEQTQIERTDDTIETEDIILTDAVNLEVEKAEESEKVKELIVKEANFPAQNQMSSSLSDQESQAIDTPSSENHEATVTDENIEAVETRAAEDLNWEPEVLDSRLVSIENQEATGTNENIKALKKQGAEDLSWEPEVSPISKAPKGEMVEGLEYPINATSSAFQLSKENKREHKVDGKDGICSFNLETVAATEMAGKKGSEEPVNSLKFEECSVPTSQIAVTAYSDTDRETPATGKPNDIEVEEQECCSTESDATEQDVYQDGEADKRSLARINGVEPYKEERTEVSEQCLQADIGSVIVPDLTDPDEILKEQAKEPSSKATSTTDNLEEDNTKKDETLVTLVDGKTVAITEAASTLQSIPREADNSKSYQELIEYKQNDILNETPKPEKAGVETSEVEPQESNSVVSSDTPSDFQMNKEIRELTSSSLDHSPEDITEPWNSKADTEDALVNIMLPEDGYEHENQRTDFIPELNYGVESSEELSMSEEKEMKDEQPKEVTSEFGNNETPNAKLNEENETIDSNPGEQATEIKKVVEESSVESPDEVRVKEEDIRTASEATGDGQIDAMLQELKAADFDNSGNNVRDQNLETRGENVCEDCGPLKMNEKVMLESQLEKTDDCVDLIKHVIDTEEAEPVPREIQFNNGKEEVTEQILSDDNLSRDLQKTTETNEAANEAAQNLNGESEAAFITKAMVEEKKRTEDGANDSSLILKRSEEEIGEENLSAHIITTEDGVEQKEESDEITDVNDAEDAETTTSDSASNHRDHDVKVVRETAETLIEDGTITDVVEEEKTEVPDDIPEPIYQHTGSATEGDKLPDEILSSENMTVHQEQPSSEKSCESTTTRAKEETLFNQSLKDPTEPGQAKETKEKFSSETLTEDKEVDVASLVTDPLHVKELSKEHDRVDPNIRSKEPVVGEKIVVSDSYQDSVSKTGDEQSLLNNINENNDKEASTKMEIQEKDDKNGNKIDAEATLQSKESLESFEPREALKLGNEFRADDEIHEQLHETGKTTADISNESVDDKDLKFMEEKLAEQNFAEGQMEMSKEVERLSEMGKQMQEEHQTKNMVLSEENLELHESTAESIGEDQSNEPEAGIDDKSGDVKDCNLGSPDQKFSAEDSRDGREITNKNTSENQTSETGRHTETNGNSMITQEIEQVPTKTQMDEVGKIKEQSVEDLIETNDNDIITQEVLAETQKDEVGEIKEQGVEEDSSNRGLDTSSSKDRSEKPDDYIITRGIEQVSAETQKNEVGDIKEQNVEGDSSNTGLDTSSSKDHIETDDDDIITQEIELVPAETQKNEVGEIEEQKVEKDSSNRKLDTSSSKDRTETNDDDFTTIEIEQVRTETQKDYVGEIEKQSLEEDSSNRGFDTSSSKDRTETNDDDIITREIEQVPAETQKDEVDKIKEQSTEENSRTRGWDTLSSNEIANTNLELHESTPESIGEDQSNEPEARIDDKSGDVKDCNLGSTDQKFSAEDSRDAREITDKNTSENQTSETGRHTETNGNSMITREIEQVPTKTQMDEVGKLKEQSMEDLIETNDSDIITREVLAETQKDEVGEIKEQCVEEDSSNRGLDTSSSKDHSETPDDYIFTRGIEQVSAETQKDEVGDIKEQSVLEESSNKGLDTSSSKDHTETDDDDIITQEIELVPAETRKNEVGEMEEQKVEKDSSNRMLDTSSSKDRTETNDDDITTIEIEQVPTETQKDYVGEIEEQSLEEDSSNRGLDTSSSKDRTETNDDDIITREIEQVPAETQKDEVGKIKEQSTEENSRTRGWDTLSSNEIANTIIYPDPTASENPKTTDKSLNKIEGDEISDKTVSSSKLTEHPEETSLEIPPEEAKCDDNATTEKIENKSTKQNDTSCTDNSENTLNTNTKEGTCMNEGNPREVEVSKLEPEIIRNIKGDGPDETKAPTEAALLEISEAEQAKHNNDRLGVKDNNAMITHEGELSAHLEIPQVIDTETEELTREDVGEVSGVAPMNDTLETYEAKTERVEGDTSNCTRLVDGGKTMSTLPEPTSLRSEITKGLNLSDQEVSVINPDVTPPTAKSLEELEGREIEDRKDEKKQNLMSDKQSMDELIIPLEEKSIAYEEGKEPGIRSSNGESKMVDETEIQGTNTAAKEGLEIPLPGEITDHTEVSEITRDTQSQGKDIIYMKHILSQTDTGESTKATLSTGSTDVPVELEVPASKTFDFEVEDLRSGNTSGAEQGRNTVDFGEGKTGGDENKEVIQQLTTVEYDSSSLAIKSQGSTKESSGVAENLVKDKEPTNEMDNQQPENVGTRNFAGAKTDEENEEEGEKNDSQEMDPSYDAQVIGEESREVDNKVHKKSHNLLSGVGSKMKHSIAKVKKAITGKSSHAKPSSPK